jgi:hypothetical protein
LIDQIFTHMNGKPLYDQVHYLVVVGLLLLLIIACMRELLRISLEIA